MPAPVRLYLQAERTGIRTGGIQAAARQDRLTDHAPPSREERVECRGQCEERRRRLLARCVLHGRARGHQVGLHPVAAAPQVIAAVVVIYQVGVDPLHLGRGGEGEGGREGRRSGEGG